MADRPLMSREEAVAVAWITCGTDSAAVVELTLLSENGDPVERFKARHALQWFDPEGSLPAEARDTAAPSSPAVEAALDAIKYVLYGWSRSDRLKAAATFTAISRNLARTA